VLAYAVMQVMTNPHSMRTHQTLTAAGIPCTVVLDSAVAYIMDQVDMVLVGTEAVVESGVSGVTYLSTE
jgi:translation initiation factor eIF-2B subunit alpha